MLRGGAALVVFLHHFRNIFFVDFNEVAHKNALVKFWYFFTGLGHDAVVVFFVLSGYFISLSVLKGYDGGNFSLVKYTIQRLTRLYTVLLPALAIGAALDFAGCAYSGAHSIYRGTLEHFFMAPSPVADWLGIWTLMGNLFFLQTILVHTYGSNGPLWSLSYEFWYYALFPMLVILAVGKPLSRIFSALTMALVLWFVGTNIAYYFIIWLMGTLVALAVQKGRAPPGTRFFMPLSFLGVVACLVLSRANLAPEIASDTLLALCVACVVWSIVGRTEVLSKPPSKGFVAYAKLATGLSAISYSLYLIHFPVLVALNGLIVNNGHRWPCDLLHNGYGILALGGTLAFVLIVWFLTESRTKAVQYFFYRKLGY